MPKKKRGYCPNLIEARHFYTFVEAGEICRREVDIIDRSEIGTSAERRSSNKGRIELKEGNEDKGYSTGENGNLCKPIQSKIPKRYKELKDDHGREKAS